MAIWWLILRRFAPPDRLQRRSQGQILELLLYADSPGLTARVLADLTGTSWRLLLALSPASLLSLLLTVLILLGLRGFCDWRPPVPGERLLVSAATVEPVQLRLGPGLRLDSQPLRTPSATFWRVVAESPGRHEIWLDHGQHAQLQVGPSWAYLRPRQAGFTIHYPHRQFWWQERQLDWPLGLGLSCLFWLGLALAFNSCWWILVRQDGRSTSRNNKNGGIIGSTAQG